MALRIFGIHQPLLPIDDEFILMGPGVEGEGDLELPITFVPQGILVLIPAVETAGNADAGAGTSFITQGDFVPSVGKFFHGGTLAGAGACFLNGPSGDAF